MLSDEHDDVSRSAGFMSEKKSHTYANARRWLRHIRAYFYTCVHACGSKVTHACTCELTIERTRFSVSHRRLFPHVVHVVDTAPFSVLLLDRLCLVLIPTIACSFRFSISSSRYSFSSSSNEQPLCNRGLPCTTLWFRVGSLAIGSYLERL